MAEKKSYTRLFTKIHFFFSPCNTFICGPLTDRQNFSRFPNKHIKKKDNGQWALGSYAPIFMIYHFSIWGQSRHRIPRSQFQISSEKFPWCSCFFQCLPTKQNEESLQPTWSAPDKLNRHRPTRRMITSILSENFCSLFLATWGRLINTADPLSQHLCLGIWMYVIPQTIRCLQKPSLW